MHVLIGFRNSEYPSLFGTGFKMASRFVTFSKDEILAVNEAATPINTKKETKFGLSVFIDRKKNSS